MDVLSFRAHFDGTNIVPDEAVELVPGTEVQVTVVIAPPGKPEASIEDKITAVRNFLSYAVPAGIPDEALRRESLYEDRA